MNSSVKKLAVAIALSSAAAVTIIGCGGGGGSSASHSSNGASSPLASAANPTTVDASAASSGQPTFNYSAFEVDRVVKFSASPVLPDHETALGLELENGTRIASLTPVVSFVQPSQKGSLRAGDVITSVNEQAVASADDIKRALAYMQPGTTIILIVKRADSGRMESVAVTTGMAKKGAGSHHA